MPSPINTVNNKGNRVRPAHLGVRSGENKLIYYYGDGLNKSSTSKTKTPWIILTILGSPCSYSPKEAT